MPVMIVAAPHSPVAGLDAQQHLASNIISSSITLISDAHLEQHMPVSSGASHGLASFVTLIIGAVFSKYIWQLLPPLGELSLYVISTIRSLTGADIPLNEQIAGMMIVMVILSFVWGVVYHVGRHS